MAYDIAIAKANNSITTTTITGTADGGASGASFSPDGTKFAVITNRVNGATSLARGVDIYTKVNSTWTRTEHIIPDFDAFIHQVIWFSDTEIWMTTLANVNNSGGIYSVSTDANESGGWSATSNQIINNGSTNADQLTQLILSPDKTRGILWTWNKNHAKIIELNGSSWNSTSITPISSNSNAHIKGATWAGNDRVVFGIPKFGDGTNEFSSKLVVYSFDNSNSTWSETESNTAVVPHALYYDSFSRTLLVWNGRTSDTGQEADSNSSSDTTGEFYVIKGFLTSQDNSSLLTSGVNTLNGWTLTKQTGASGPSYTNLLPAYGHNVIADPNNSSRVIFQTVNRKDDSGTGGYSTSKLYCLEWEFEAVRVQDRWVLTELHSGYGTNTSTFNPGFSPNGEIIVNSGLSTSDDLLMLFSDGLGFLQESECDDGYPICDAVNTNNRSIQNVVASNTNGTNDRYPVGGVPSPDGNTVAVITDVRNGGDGSTLDVGIDFYTLDATSVWTLSDSIDIGGSSIGNTNICLQWRNNDELWYLKPGFDTGFPQGLCKTEKDSNGNFTTPVKAANELWLTGDNSALKISSGNARYFVFNEEKDACFLWYQDSKSYVIFYSGSQTETPGVWDGMAFSFATTTDASDYLTQIMPGSRDGDKQVFYSSQLGLGRVWATIIDFSQWPVPDPTTNVVTVNRPSLTSPFTVDLDDPAHQRLTFALSEGLIAQTLNFQGDWLLRTGYSNRITAPARSYAFQASRAFYFGAVLYWHGESNKILVYESLVSDSSGQFNATLHDGYSSGQGIDLDDLGRNGRNWRQVNSYENKIWSFEKSTTDETNYFDNPVEILPSLLKPPASAHRILPAYDNDRIFFRG